MKRAVGYAEARVVPQSTFRKSQRQSHGCCGVTRWQAFGSVDGSSFYRVLSLPVRSERSILRFITAAKLPADGNQRQCLKDDSERQRSVRVRCKAPPAIGAWGRRESGREDARDQRIRTNRPKLVLRTAARTSSSRRSRNRGSRVEASHPSKGDRPAPCMCRAGGSCEVMYLLGLKQPATNKVNF